MSNFQQHSSPDSRNSNNNPTYLNNRAKNDRAGYTPNNNYYNSRDRGGGGYNRRDRGASYASNDYDDYRDGGGSGGDFDRRRQDFRKQRAASYDNRAPMQTATREDFRREREASFDSRTSIPATTVTREDFRRYPPATTTREDFRRDSGPGYDQQPQRQSMTASREDFRRDNGNFGGDTGSYGNYRYQTPTVTREDFRRDSGPGYEQHQRQSMTASREDFRPKERRKSEEMYYNANAAHPNRRMPVARGASSESFEGHSFRKRQRDMTPQQQQPVPLVESESTPVRNPVATPNTGSGTTSTTKRSRWGAAPPSAPAQPYNNTNAAFMRSNSSVVAPSLVYPASSRTFRQTCHEPFLLDVTSLSTNDPALHQMLSLQQELQYFKNQLFLNELDCSGVNFLYTLDSYHSLLADERLNHTRHLYMNAEQNLLF